VQLQQVLLNLLINRCDAWLDARRSEISWCGANPRRAGT